jgi:hypothetical protein
MAQGGIAALHKVRKLRCYCLKQHGQGKHSLIEIDADHIASESVGAHSGPPVLIAATDRCACLACWMVVSQQILSQASMHAKQTSIFARTFAKREA